MSSQPPRGPPLSVPTRPGFRYGNPTTTQQQRGMYRSESRDSGIASSNYQAGPSKQQQSSTSAQSASFANDFDWGDDDDDMDIVMASQQVEAALEKGGVPSTSRRLQSSPSGTRDAAMTLGMRRYEIALKESNGEDVKMEDFVQDGCLGGDISADKDDKNTLLERVQDLEKLNKTLQQETYTCKGEATNLRKKVEKHMKEKEQELINRQKREKEIREKEAAYKKEMSTKVESLQTELKFSKGELRSAAELNEALRKKLRKIETDLTQTSQMSSSAVPKFDMDITKNFPSTQSTSSGFNLSKSKFYKREVVNSPAHSAYSQAVGSPASIATIPVLSPKKSVITVAAEAQTEDLLAEKPFETALRLWKEHHKLRQERLQNSIEKISVMATKQFQLILPKLKKISQTAETKLVRDLNIEGYRYELFFPGNLKIAEFKMDLDKETKPKSNPRIPKFPSQCEDWRGIDAFETTVNQILFSQRDIWATMCYVLNDIVKRINCMRRKRRNSVYRANNCLHMFKLMSWAANLWYNFRQEFWLIGKPEDMENGIYEEIRQWTAAMLWIGNHYFGVLEFQVRIRPFVLRTLINMERNEIFHCTYANYLRLYYLIYHTLTIDRHATAENLNLCLQLARAVDRKKFVIDFMCRGRNDGTCLAHLFGTKTMELFLKEKDPERRFRMYNNYLELLATIRVWCCVHVSGESQCEDGTQQEDVDDTDVNPVFVTKFTERTTEVNSTVGMTMSRRFHSTITSFYGSEEITFDDDDDDGDVDDSSTQPINREPARKKQRLDSKSDSSGTVTISTNAAVRGTSSEITTQVMNENRMPGGLDESEVSEDEYDGVQAEARELLENVQERNQQPNDEICRTFLDCSQWEELKDGSNFGSCQCRHHLMETFMRMTEEVIHIWRHVKTNFEFQKLSNEASKSESETLQTEVDELVRLLDERERTEVKSNAEMDLDFLLNKENPYWKRIIQDGNMVKPVLRPDEISNRMDLIVDILDDTYSTTQHNTKQAFGSEGTNAFHAVIAYLLQFLKAFNLSQYNRERIYRIASGSFFKTKSNSKQDISTSEQKMNTSEQKINTSEKKTSFPDQKLLEEIPSGYEDFDEPVVPFTQFPRDFQNENIRACLPPTILQSIDELEERIAAPRLVDSSMNQADEDVMEVGYYEQSRRRPRDSLNTSGDLFTHATSTINGKNDDAEDSCESASESEDVTEEDSGWETVDSDDSDNEGDKKKFVKVEDYDKFGGPALEEQRELFEEPPQKFQVTHKQLLAAFKKGPKIKYDNLVKFKSARTACEELKKAGSVTGPSLDDCVECPKGTENLIQKLMSRMNVQDYYKDGNPLWNDYKDRSHPVNI